jgi:hypothetical protein
MKKIIATLAVIFSLTTSATYAYDGLSVSTTVLKSFSREFVGARNASWEAITDGLYKVTFSYETKDVQAFFDENGNIIATGSIISEEQLPFLVSKSLNSKYNDFAKNEIVEFTMNGETQYLVTVSDVKKAEVLKISNQGDIVVYKKLKQ